MNPVARIVQGINALTSIAKCSSWQCSAWDNTLGFRKRGRWNGVASDFFRFLPFFCFFPCYLSVFFRLFRFFPSFPFLSVSLSFFPFFVWFCCFIFFRFLPFLFVFPFLFHFSVFFHFSAFSKKKRGGTVGETPFAKPRIHMEEPLLNELNATKIPREFTINRHREMRETLKGFKGDV